LVSPHATLLTLHYYGNHRDQLSFPTRRSSDLINYSLGVDSPSRFYDGALEYTQNVLNADVSRDVDWGRNLPATLSFGAEYRREKWNQSPGEPDSYAGSGAQGFAGFSPRNAGHYDRHNWAVYAGLEADLNDRFSA